MENRLGPKGKFTPETLEMVANLVEKGATDKEVIKALGISSTTFYRWIQEKRELRETINRSKRVRAQKLEPKLFKRANGYSYRETTRTRNPDTGKMEITKIVTKHMAPDVAALKFYLSNYMPETYYDKNHVFVLQASPETHELPASVQEMLDRLHDDLA